MMQHMRCPCCGGPFDGKKCTQCLYVPFKGDTAPVRLHRRTLRATNSPSYRQHSAPTFRSESQPRQGRGKVAAAFYRSFRMLRVLFVILMITAICTTLFSVVRSMSEDRWSDAHHAVPETAPREFTAYELYSGNGIRLLADWNGGAIPQDMYCEIENSTDLDLTVTTRAVSVNGMMLEGSYLYCSVASGERESCTLWADEDELDRLGIRNIETLSLILDIAESDTYEPVASTELLTFGPGLRTEVPDQGGTEVFLSQDLRLCCMDPGVDDYGNRYIQFYGENRSGGDLVVMTDTVALNDQEVDLGLVQTFYPDTRGVFRLYLYDFQMESFGDWEWEDLEELKLTLWLIPQGDYDRGIYTDPILIRLDD